MSKSDRKFFQSCCREIKKEILALRKEVSDLETDVEKLSSSLIKSKKPLLKSPVLKLSTSGRLNGEIEFGNVGYSPAPALVRLNARTFSGTPTLTIRDGNAVILDSTAVSGPELGNSFSQILMGRVNTKYAISMTGYDTTTVEVWFELCALGA